jgi:Calx-beta domain
VVVPMLDDATYENDESYTLNLSNMTNGLIQDATGDGSITSDDAAPVLTIADVSVTEHTGSAATASFTVTKAGATEVDAVADWATVDGTALAGSDYGAASGTLTFGPGQVSKTIDVTVTGDAIDEPNESFSVTLSNPVHATVSDPTGVGTIVDNDKIPTSLTLKAGKSSSTVRAKGLLEPALSGFAVKVTLLKKVGGSFKRVGRKVVTVRRLRDRDGDGLDEGVYLATFTRGPKGTYKFVVKYAGNANYQSVTKTKVFKV